MTGRGIARQEVVTDGAGRDKWIELLQRSAEQHGWRAFPFALLTNHYRRFLQTPEPSADALHVLGAQVSRPRDAEFESLPICGRIAVALAFTAPERGRMNHGSINT